MNIYLKQTQSAEPIFLIGAERSGTTLLRLMLNGHPKVAWLNEFEYAVDQITSEYTWPDLSRYYAYLKEDRIFKATKFQIDKTLNYENLIKSFLVQKANRENKEMIGATCHRHYQRLLRIFPNAKFIYIIRDPRDVAVSNISMGWAGNVLMGVNRWVAAERLWDEVKNYIDGNNYIEIYYEDLIKDNKNSLLKICEFLDIQYDEQMIAYPETTSYSVPNPKHVEKWKKKLSKNELELVEWKVFTKEKSKRYEQELKDINAPSLLKMKWLWIQDRFYRFKFRVKRYGLRVVLSGFISKRLKLKNWESKVRAEFNDITNQYLR